MRRAGRNAIAVAGVVGFLLALLSPCPCAETMRSAAGHDCCAPLPGLRAADDSCGSGPGNAAPVLSVPFPPPFAAVAESPSRSAVAAVSMVSPVDLPRPSSSAPPILRI
jgi:hypothetical protein